VLKEAVGREIAELVLGGDKGGRMGGDDDGTCWNALVTSCKDMREGAVGGGVSPSSDLTSWIVNGTDERSSAIPSRELTAGTPGLSDVCDHTAFKSSGSGTLEGESFIVSPNDVALCHGAAAAGGFGGVNGSRSD
jgi:hypothetical protein